MRILLISLLLLQACSFDTLDRPASSQFQAISQNEFEMTAREKFGISEKAHQRWIKHYLEKNNMCRSGFAITDSQKTRDDKGIKDYYKGTCRQY